MVADTGATDDMSSWKDQFSDYKRFDKEKPVKVEKGKTLWQKVKELSI